MAQRIPLGPPSTSPRPQPRPVDQRMVTGEPVRGKMDGFLGEISKSPQAQAFLIQTVASLLGQQGLFPALGQGVAAMGRFAQADAQATRERAAAAQQAMAARRGGGGGGGAAVPQDGTLDMKAFNKAHADVMKRLMDADVEMSYEQMLGLATAEAMMQQGFNEPMQAYLATPEADRPFVAQEYAGGPAAAMNFLESFKTAQTDPQNTAAPGFTTPTPALTAPGGGTAPTASAIPSAPITAPAVPLAVPQADLAPVAPQGATKPIDLDAASQKENAYNIYRDLRKAGLPHEMAKAQSGYQGPEE